MMADLRQLAHQPEEVIRARLHEMVPEYQVPQFDKRSEESPIVMEPVAVVGTASSWQKSHNADIPPTSDEQLPPDGIHTHKRPASPHHPR